MTTRRVNLFGSSVPLLIVVALTAGLVLALSLSGAYLWLQSSAAAGFEGLEFVDPKPAADFSLTDYRGDTFRLSDHAGKVVFLYFGYTMCPDACPTTLLDFRRTREGLGNQKENVVFAFITVDPERDTPQVLREYMDVRGDESFFALTGTEEELQQVIAAYNIFAEKVEVEDSRVGYWINHTALSYVVDPKGYLRVAHPFGMTYESMLHDTKLLLREGR